MAVLHKETLDLEHNGHRLSGVLVRPEGDAPLPRVVQIQEWWGIEPHVLDVAQRLAAAGFAVLVPDLYHGKIVTEPDEATKAEEIRSLQAPVLALYGGNDPSIPVEQIHKIRQMLESAGKNAEVRIYPAAGHAFLNPAHGALHAESAKDAWPRAVAFLQQQLTQGS